MGWTGHMTHIEEKRNAYKILFPNPDGTQKADGRYRRKWQSNIKLNVREILFEMDSSSQ
jgi:hypothetical protein